MFHTPLKYHSNPMNAYTMILSEFVLSECSCSLIIYFTSTALTTLSSVMFHTLLKYHSNSVDAYTMNIPHKRRHITACNWANFFVHRPLRHYTSTNTEGWIIPALTWTLYFFLTLQRKHWFYNWRNITYAFRPHLTIYGMAWGQELYKVASSSIQPFHHNTSLWPTNQPHQLYDSRKTANLLWKCIHLLWC